MSEIERLKREVEVDDYVALRMLRHAQRHNDRGAELRLAYRFASRKGAQFSQNGTVLPLFHRWFPSVIVKNTYGQIHLIDPQVELQWCPRTARLFAIDCARLVLPVYECEYPGDMRAMYTLELARRFADGEPISVGGYLDAPFAMADDRASSIAYRCMCWTLADSAWNAASNSAYSACLSASIHDGCTYDSYAEGVIIPLLIRHLCGMGE